ncbi:Na+/H+ antiporter [Roseovarius arcticus]|uniref:Na+/H+ antiporter n=1 Tax=Roseovarius arcticus TaxID=2547404 RepID=UPI00110FFF06|nr:Na+/H+ antiporter [Roseovarius arcticus]
MDAIFTSLTLLTIVVLSGIVGRITALPVPRPLVQIAFGAIAGLIPLLEVDLEPEVFFLLLVPPLLFIDGWRISTDELVRDRWQILHMAFGLVVVTVLVIGTFIAWLVPALPAGVAFALAAALAPTDPISVTSIARRVPIPQRMMNLLHAESLLNDATGLICLSFAVVFILAGSFSIGSASASFLWVAGAGLAIGFGITLAIVRAKTWVVTRIGEDPGTQIVVSLLIPFIAYLLAEAASASGLFAAVAAGVTMARAEATGLALGATRIQRTAVWDSVQFVANGIVFVLLGEQLPKIVASAQASVSQTGHHSLWWPLLLITVIYTAMLILRAIWVWISVILSRRHASQNTMPVWRLVAATTMAGSRGAITFAGILTLPVLLSSGEALEDRDLVILIAMGVIVLSLVMAAISLPLLLRSGPTLPSQDLTADRIARTATATAALAEIGRISDLHATPDSEAETYVAAAAQVSRRYLQRLETIGQQSEEDPVKLSNNQILQEIQLAAVRAERQAVFKMRRKKTVGAVMARRMVRELDLLEAHYEI